MDPSVRRFTPITVPWDLLIYMKMGMVWAEIFAGLFGFWFSCGVIFFQHRCSSVGYRELCLGGGERERWERDGAAEGSGRHVFFPVHKIGFCLSQQGDDLEVVDISTLPFLCYQVAFQLSFVPSD
jgi:hypothetical protein